MYNRGNSRKTFFFRLSKHNNIYALTFLITPGAFDGDEFESGSEVVEYRYIHFYGWVVRSANKNTVNY